MCECDARADCPYRGIVQDAVGLPLVDLPHNIELAQKQACPHCTALTLLNARHRSGCPLSTSPSVRRVSSTT